MGRLDEAMSDLIELRASEGPDHLIDALRRRLAGDAEVIPLPRRAHVDTSRVRITRRGPLIAAGALAAALLLAVPILWLGGSDETASVDPAPVPTTVAPPTTTAIPLTTAIQTTVLASHLEPAPLQLGDGIGFSQSGDTLWAWDGEGGVAGYRDGLWQTLPPLPDAVRDVAGTLNGPLWAVTDRGLWHLEDGEWQNISQEALPVDLGIDVARVEVDGTGTVWVLAGADLYRWDGIEMTQLGSDPEETILDDFVVAQDGTIWGGRSNFYFPELDRLVRFDLDTGAWVSVRPLGSIEDLPASVAITPSGNLWVALTDAEARPVLASLDMATGEWATHRLHQGGFDIVAGEEVAWFQSTSELFRFDGETLAEFSPGGWLDNIGLGNDGTLWVTIRYEHNGIYRLVIDEEPIE
jgi:hypothetical protein